MVALLAMSWTIAASAQEKSDSEADQELARVQGTWARTVETDGGTFKIVKVHEGNKSTVTTYYPDGKVAAAKTSEFRLEKMGSVRVFTFFNNVATEGPQKGQVDKRPTSYIYRVSDDKFYEVQGMMVGDSGDPVSFYWRRVKAL